MSGAEKRIRDGALARVGLMADSAAAEVVRRAEAEEIETIRIVFADGHGILRGKTITRAALTAAMSSGVRAPSTLLLKDLSHRTVFPIWSEAGDAPFHGASDILLAPRPETFRPLPWSPHSALMLAEPRALDGAEIGFSSHAILSRAEAALAGRGLTGLFGLEVEFQIFEIADPALAHEDATMPPRPPETRNLNPGWRYLTESRYDEAEAVLDDIRRAAEGMGMPVRSVEIEMGPSQFEFTFDAAGPMAVADMVTVFRTLAGEVCRRRGLLASFMPKPRVANAAANGWHIHQSLSDREGLNLFTPGENGGLTKTAGALVAGLLDNAAASCVATNPTVNGYKRFTEFQLAPTRIGWGRDNRGAMIRALTAPGDPASRIENRVPDSAANPYYALAFQIMAGLDGIERGLAPPPELANPYDEGAARLPATLGEAIDAFESSDAMRSALGEEFADYLIRLKRAEWNRYLSVISEWEQAEYFSVF